MNKLQTTNKNQANKVFVALTDAYNYYKNERNI